MLCCVAGAVTVLEVGVPCVRRSGSHVGFFHLHWTLAFFAVQASLWPFPLSAAGCDRFPATWEGRVRGQGGAGLLADLSDSLMNDRMAAAGQIKTLHLYRVG